MKLSKFCCCCRDVKKGLFSPLVGVSGPLLKWLDMAAEVTNGLSVGDANPRGAENPDSLLEALADGWPFSSLVIVNSDGSLLELLCLRRLLVGPWKSLGDVCRDRLRDPCELDGVAPFVEFIKGPEPG